MLGKRRFKMGRLKKKSTAEKPMSPPTTYATVTGLFSISLKSSDTFANTSSTATEPLVKYALTATNTAVTYAAPNIRPKVNATKPGPDSVFSFFAKFFGAFATCCFVSPVFFTVAASCVDRCSAASSSLIFLAASYRPAFSRSSCSMSLARSSAAARRSAANLSTVAFCSNANSEFGVSEADSISDLVDGISTFDSSTIGADSNRDLNDGFSGISGTTSPPLTVGAVGMERISSCNVDGGASAVFPRASRSACTCTNRFAFIVSFRSCSCSALKASACTGPTKASSGESATPAAKSIAIIEF
mmetsp:Transcript_3959/g.6776  ORF Transcript_3959/g.6776 Transcript_3959/m.6776 type:complete len:302 (-) Transcript_3959:217-1122(-)